MQYKQADMVEGRHAFYSLVDLSIELSINEVPPPTQV